MPEFCHNYTIFYFFWPNPAYLTEIAIWYWFSTSSNILSPIQFLNPFSFATITSTKLNRTVISSFTTTLKSINLWKSISYTIRITFNIITMLIFSDGFPRSSWYLARNILPRIRIYSFNNSLLPSILSTWTVFLLLSSWFTVKVKIKNTFGNMGML